MGTDSETVAAPLPAFASVTNDSGVTKLRIQTRAATWLKRGWWGIPVGVVSIVAVLTYLLQLSSKDATPLAWWQITGAVLCGALLLGLFLLGTSCLLVTKASGEIIFDGIKLCIRDFGSSYEIPIADVHSIRHVAYPGSRLEIDISGPPSHFFFRGRRTAMEIGVPGGLIQLFRVWGEPKVAWMVGRIKPLVFPDTPESAIEIINPRDDGNMIVGGRSYGPPKRWFIRCLLLIGITVAAASLWNAYNAWSSNSWPTAEGKVIHSSYEESVDSEGKNRTYKAEIRYTYHVLGGTYTNDAIGFQRFADEGAVKSLVVNHPDASNITVHYDPTLPDHSVVIPGLSLMCWVFCMPGPLLLLLGGMNAFQSNTAEQAALSRRYKVFVDRRKNKFAGMTAKVEWSVPAEAWLAAVQRNRRASWWMGLRVMAITAIALWFAHHWVAPICPPDFQWKRVGEIIMGFAGVFALAKVFETVMIGHGSPPAYRITSEGILLSFGEHPLIRWNSIVSFSVERDLRQSNFRNLRIYSIRGHRRDLTLLGGERDVLIISEISNRVPEGLPPAKFRALSGWDWFLGFVLAASVIWGGGVFLNRHLHVVPGSIVVDWILIGGLVAGPGTWIALALRGRRAKDQVIAYAGMLNLFAIMGMLLAAVIKRLS